MPLNFDLTMPFINALSTGSETPLFYQAVVMGRN
jgi:hypothetical protein